jgi:sugar phosphate isomerase/epimerase
VTGAGGTGIDGWVLWSGTVGLESPIAPRIAAAVGCGYTHLSLSPLDIVRAEAGGTSAADVGRAVHDAGLEIILDPVMNWYPGGGPSRSRFAGISAADSLRMVADLGAGSLTAVAAGASPGSASELAEPFGRLCDRAGDVGALVHLEFIPMTVVRDLHTALAIVGGADRPNGGIVFDTWHFFRGDPDFELLARTPGDVIFAVQLDDGLAEVEGTLWEDTQRRLAPGCGSFDLTRAVRTLAAIGGLRRVGPEILHPDYTARPAREAAALAGECTRAVIDQALGGCAQGRRDR